MAANPKIANAAPNAPRSERSELLENPSAAIHPISDSAAPQGIPIGDCVDGQDRLAEPALRLRRDRDGRKRGADLHEGVDIRAVELLQAGADLLGRDLGDEP